MMEGFPVPHAVLSAWSAEKNRHAGQNLSPPQRLKDIFRVKRIYCVIWVQAKGYLKGDRHGWLIHWLCACTHAPCTRNFIMDILNLWKSVKERGSNSLIECESKKVEICASVKWKSINLSCFTYKLFQFLGPTKI